MQISSLKKLHTKSSVETKKSFNCVVIMKSKLLCWSLREICVVKRYFKSKNCVKVNECGKCTAILACDAIKEFWKLFFSHAIERCQHLENYHIIITQLEDYTWAHPVFFKQFRNLHIHVMYENKAQQWEKLSQAPTLAVNESIEKIKIAIYTRCMCSTDPFNFFTFVCRNIEIV